MKYNGPNTVSLRGVNEGSVSSVMTAYSKGSQNSNNILSVGPGYRLIKKIGAGNFGEIWLATSLTRRHDCVAVKLEQQRRKPSQLHTEYKIYRRLGKNSFMPLAYYFCQTTKYNALVMDLLGPSLEEIFKLNDNKFNIKTMLLISMQIIRIFEFIHSNGIIYRDVKPQNFLQSRMPLVDGNIYIVDFGLAKEYINPLTNLHIPYGENKNLTGTARYMSINTHLGREQSRRDDLESIGHMLIYFMKGGLPWQGLHVHEGEDHYTKIGQVKIHTPIEELCKGVPDAWKNYLIYCRNLDFYERPDYSYLHNLFRSYFDEFNFSNDNFDWICLPNSDSTKTSNSTLPGNQDNLNLWDDTLKTNTMSIPSFLEMKQNKNYNSDPYHHIYPDRTNRIDVYKSYMTRVESPPKKKNISLEFLYVALFVLIKKSNIKDL
ncbi:hypothetical protein HZS_5028 [Henneguya salminicola]|nr:hypothetical protein HZS_5028 [Henneguya salminicola]